MWMSLIDISHMTYHCLFSTHDTLNNDRYTDIYISIDSIYISIHVNMYTSIYLYIYNIKRVSFDLFCWGSQCQPQTSVHQWGHILSGHRKSQRLMVQTWHFNRLKKAHWAGVAIVTAQQIPEVEEEMRLGRDGFPGPVCEMDRSALSEDLIESSRRHSMHNVMISFALISLQRLKTDIRGLGFAMLWQRNVTKPFR